MTSLVCKGQLCLPFLWTLAIWNRCISCGFSNDMVELKTFLTSRFHNYLMGSSCAIVDPAQCFTQLPSPLSPTASLSCCTASHTAAGTAWGMLYSKWSHIVCMARCCIGIECTPGMAISYVQYVSEEIMSYFAHRDIFRIVYYSCYILNWCCPMQILNVFVIYH